MHGTLLVDADLDSLRACLAGPRGGELDGLPRPAMSRPDHVANVGGSVEAAEAAILHALAPGADVAAPGDEHAQAAAGLMASRYADREWHSGPWAAVTPPATAAVLGGK